MYLRKIRAEQLIVELAAHVAESVRMAERGDDEAKRWLMSTFPGNIEHFKRVWSAPAQPAKRELDVRS